MTVIQQRDRDIASLRRRALAAAIDVTLFLAPLGAWLVVVVKRKARRRARDGRRGEPSVPGGLASLHRWTEQLAQSMPRRVLLRALSVAFLSVPMRNWRSPGARITGIRVVDARTRGPVSVRSVLIGEAFDRTYAFLFRRLTAPLRHQSDADRERLRELRPQMTALQREHADDRAAEREAMMDSYRANDLNPMTSSSCAWVLPATLIIPLTACRSRQRQTLRQRVSGTVVVRGR